jgi:hypothetical protein
MVAALFVGCGDGDSTKIKICTAKKTTCLTNGSGTVCSTDGTTQLPFVCGEGEVCGTDEEGTTGCAASCEPGATECASETVSRVCSNSGTSWVNVACDPGTGCDNDEDSDTFGTCVRSGPNVTVCEPEEATCADGQTIKSCEEDGSNWVYTACLANEMCEDGECIVDPEKKCTPNTGTCVDATHVKKCADTGTEYLDPEECPAETTCSDGACRGPVCTVGEVRCDDVRDGNVFTALLDGTYQAQAVYTCVDGVSWEVTQCDASELCTYTDISSTAVNQFIEDVKSAIGDDFESSSSDIPVFNVPESSRATCQAPECPAPYAFREIVSGFFEGSFGSFACGDPRDEGAAFPDSFSLCEGLPPYNRLHWANYTCPEGSECGYQMVATPSNPQTVVPVCQSTCTEGDVRCLESDESGESTITCVDGEWDPGTVEKCHDGGREQWCGTNILGTPNDIKTYTQGTCQDPACVVWRDAFETFVIPPGYGACGDDGMFYQCGPDGLMGAAEECGSCTRAVSGQPQSTFAGYPPGTCIDECVRGEQRCIVTTIGTVQSPFYYECVDGHFTEVASCPDGEACNDFLTTDTEPLRKIVCGTIECQPGRTRCSDDEGLGVVGDLLQTCNEQGQWDAPEQCSRGVCTQDDQQRSGAAECEDECIRGTKTCSGSIAQVTCDRNGRYGDPESCESPMQCPVNFPELTRLGCVECLPATPNNVADTRCDGADLQICNPDGTWNTSNGSTCPNGCSGSKAGDTITPGNWRANCNPTGSGGTNGGGGAGSGPGGAGSGGAAGFAGFPPGGFGGIDG